MAFVTAGIGIIEVLDDVGGPLVGLSKQHPAGELIVDDLAAVLEEGVCLGQVLAVGAVPLEEVLHRVQPEPVDSQTQPEPQDVDHGLLHGRVVVVQIGLMGEETVPVELPAHRVERPVGFLGVDEDDPSVVVPLTGVAPHVEVAVRAVGISPGFLEPRMRVGCVIHHQVGDDADTPAVRLVEQCDEVVDGAELRQHPIEAADVVATVA